MSWTYCPDKRAQWKGMGGRGGTQRGYAYNVPDKQFHYLKLTNLHHTSAHLSRLSSLPLALLSPSLNFLFVMYPSEKKNALILHPTPANHPQASLCTIKLTPTPLQRNRTFLEVCGTAGRPFTVDLSQDRSALFAKPKYIA